MTSTNTQSTGPVSFESHVREVVLALRNALGAILAALPGQVRRAYQVQKALGIEKKLAWRFVKLIDEANPFLAAQYMPGTAGVKILLKAARQHNVPEAVIESMVAAAAEFERAVSLHATDRASFEMMLAAAQNQSDNRADVDWRKSSFLGNSYTWGGQAKAQLRTFIVHRSPTQVALDVVRLGGLVAFRRTRSNPPWCFGRRPITNDEGEALPQIIFKPLETESDADSDSQSMPLLPQFCSKPMPKFHCRVENDLVYDELVETRVGNTAASTFFTGEVARALPLRYCKKTNESMMHGVQLRTPCEMLIFDQIVHEDLFGTTAPTFSVYSELCDGPSISLPGMERNLLPVNESVEYLGKGPSAVYTPVVPNYADMMTYACEKCGWDSKRFDVYRVVMPFPPIPARGFMIQPICDDPGK